MTNGLLSNWTFSQIEHLIKMVNDIYLNTTWSTTLCDAPPNSLMDLIANPKGKNNRTIMGWGKFTGS
jgi:hypothetical protein